MLLLLDTFFRFLFSRTKVKNKKKKTFTAPIHDHELKNQRHLYNLPHSGRMPQILNIFFSFYFVQHSASVNSMKKETSMWYRIIAELKVSSNYKTPTSIYLFSFLFILFSFSFRRLRTYNKYSSGFFFFILFFSPRQICTYISRGILFPL